MIANINYISMIFKNMTKNTTSRLYARCEGVCTPLDPYGANLLASSFCDPLYPFFLKLALFS